MKRASRLISLLLFIRLVFSTIYVSASAETEYKIGDIVEFGSYPQTQVTDDALITELNSFKLNWKWYDYYKLESVYPDEANPEHTVPSELMKYADITYNGERYRAVFIKEYREEIIGAQKKNDFLLDTVYWYKYEPLAWRVLDPKEGLVFTEKAIDSQPIFAEYYYNNDYSYNYYTDSSMTKFLNEYEFGSIRNWLNDDFLNTAFTLEQSCNIAVRDLNSDGKLCDKVFLLSLDEVKSVDYGFMDDATEIDPARICYGTDYALSQGLYIADNCPWFLRSSDSCNEHCVVLDTHIDSICYGRNGEDDNGGLRSISEHGGIRPAIRLDLNALETKPEHICTPSTEWSFDETAHWLECTDPECGEITGYAEHSGGNATVNAKAVCEYCCTAYGEYVAASYSVESVSDIAYCAREKREYRITVAENADKIQFIRSTGSTTTFVRSQAAEIIDNGDGTETWILAVSLNKGKYTLATKYGKVWNKNGIVFEIVFDTPKCRSFTSEKVGNLTTFTVVTDPQVAKIQLITQSGNTLTYTQSNSYIGEDGLRYWTVLRKVTKPGTIGLRTKYGYTWTTTDFTIEV